MTAAAVAWTLRAFLVSRSIWSERDAIKEQSDAAFGISLIPPSLFRMWEPLPLIVYGYAVHPLSPSRRETRSTSQNRLSTVTEVSADDHSVMRDVVSLEVGDEVYAFEKYTPSPREPPDNIWFRGYVVCTTRQPPVTWSLTDAAPRPTVKTDETQQVFIGIFPKSHIYVRDELPDAEARLPEISRQFASNAADGSIHSGLGRASPMYYHRDKGSIGAMDPVKEESEEADLPMSRKSFKLGPPPDQANSSRAALSVYPTSLRSSSPAESAIMKPALPRPSLKSGDDTASAVAQPIVDEIASALREWHAFMFQYLARREYKLFMIVRDHIEALHLGRRQLLAQTLSAEEIVNMRRDCVTRLVSGNLIQCLDVIVRHPTWGGLASVDLETDSDTRNWVSAVRMYAMQVSLAYLNLTTDDSRTFPRNSVADTSSSTPLPTPAQSVFHDTTGPLTNPRPRTLGFDDRKSPAAKFYHVFLDVRALVASPCAAGESAELYFSLYKKQGTQFVTEDFCAIFNHHGVLARDPAARIRTLFVDLAASDIQDPIYLVCRIVRNGTLKANSVGMTSQANESMHRVSEVYSRSDTPTQGTMSLGWTDSINGSIVSRTTAMGDGSSLRRPFGCAVLELTQLSKMAAEQADISPLKEHTMPIYVPTNETSFSMIHQNIINNNVKEIEKSPRADTLAVSIKVLRGELKNVVRENTSLLQDTPQTLRLGFPDVVFPGESRNEVYIKLWCGDFINLHKEATRLSVSHFSRGSAGHSTNVQITVEVRDQHGMTMENVISQGSGEPLVSQFHSLVFQRCSEPTFGELIKIQLPSSEEPNWHLFFTFRNRTPRPTGKGAVDTSDRPFAFAFQPLFPESGAFVEDGSHTLIMYRADRLGQFTTATYLSGPSHLIPNQKFEQLTIPSELMRVASPLKDTLTIRTSLCSTRFTQNPILARLLNWQRQDKEILSTLLTKFTFVGEGEIVKFLRDIFDSLFGILSSNFNQSSEFDLLVFNALVTVLGIVQDRRFSNFQPVLDVYIKDHFNCAAASSHIIQSMNRLLATPTDSHLRAALKVWHYIYKFIARARELQRAKERGMAGGATVEHLEQEFRSELRNHINAVTQMMSMTSPPGIIGTQTIALQHFAQILPELAKIYPMMELVLITSNFANAASVNKGKIVIWRLIMYLHLVKGFMFDDPQARVHLIDSVVIWISPHLGRYDEYSHTSSNDNQAERDASRVSWLEWIRLSVTILAIMLDKLQNVLVDPAIMSDRRAYAQEQANVECLLSLLPKLLDSYTEIQSPSSKDALDRIKAVSTTKTSHPVTFPESYPFSLIASLPGPVRNGVPSTGEGETFYPALGETAIVFLVLILVAPTQGLASFMTAFLDDAEDRIDTTYAERERERLIVFLNQFFKVATSIIHNNAWPKTWLNVNILAHQVFIKMMEPISMVMERIFVPPAEQESTFNVTLWKECLHMLLRLLSSEHLMIEDFSAQKRRAVWRLARDIRGKGAQVLLSLWQALGAFEHHMITGEPPIRFGGYQIYLHSLVGHVIDLCLSHHDLLRSNAVQILYSMIVSEYRQSEHFDQIENELVTRLDALFMSDSKADEISRTFFISHLRHLFESSDVEDQLQAQVASFLESVDLFLELLLSVRALPEGEEYADDRVIATLRLMNFIRRIGRDEIYIKYVHQLVNMHLQSQNYVEAALTLKLHSDLHEWDLNAFVPPMEDLGLPQQSQFHRKETLSLLVLDYLGKGKAWESAIEICKDLAFQHAEVTFNYERLSEILRHQASLLDHIISDQRYYPDYYRVTFYGNFPAAIRDKCFVYRGYEWEKYGAFCERMLNKHPEANLLKSAGEPPEEVRFGNDQYIQCVAVTPEPNRKLAVFTNPDVPLRVRTYYEHSAINLFSSSQQVRKPMRDGNGEEVWQEKAYYTTEESFPTVLRRSEVVNVEVVEISPLELALQEVEEKSKELGNLHQKYSALAKTNQEVSTNALAMALNSAVDAPLNTGIGVYRQTFFSPDYISKYPERAEEVEKLRAAIDDQVRMIDSCLRLHGLLCPPVFTPFHEQLVRFFKKNFRDEIRRLAVDSSQLQHDPTSPLSPSSSSVSGGNLKRTLSTSSSSRNGTGWGAGRAMTMMTPPLESDDLEQDDGDRDSGGRWDYSTSRNGTDIISVDHMHHTHHRDRAGSSAAAGVRPSASVSGSGSTSTQTPLQRHLAHLAKHGIHAVSSGPNDTGGGIGGANGGGGSGGAGGSDSMSINSFGGARDSMVVGTSVVPTGAASASGSTSVKAPSYMGSMGSFGSIKGRLSRFGSLNFGSGGKRRYE